MTKSSLTQKEFDTISLQPTCNKLATDTIYRQAAIDQLHQSYNLLDAEQRLEDVPSAQSESCEDAVSRRSILDKISKKDNWEKHDRYNIGLSDARKIVQDEPPVTPKQKTGKWLDGKEESGALNIVYTEHICSECEYSYSFPIKYNFCPNCGADMRG